MSKLERAALFAGLAGCVLAGILLTVDPRGASYYAQAVGLVALLGGLAAIPTARNWIVSVPMSHRVAVVGFTGCMLFGQLAHQNLALFPLVSWTMYTSSEANTYRVVRFFGETPDNRRVNLYSETRRVATREAVSERIVNLIDELISEGGRLSHLQRTQRVDGMVWDLARRYMLAHPDSRIEAVVVEARELEIDRLRGGYKEQHETLWRTEIGTGASE